MFVFIVGIVRNVHNVYNIHNVHTCTLSIMWTMWTHILYIYSWVLYSGYSELFGKISHSCKASSGVHPWSIALMISYSRLYFFAIARASGLVYLNGVGYRRYHSLQNSVFIFFICYFLIFGGKITKKGRIWMVEDPQNDRYPYNFE